MTIQKIVFSIIVIAGIGCGRSNVLDINPELYSYVASFEGYLSKPIENLIVKFSDVLGGDNGSIILGTCTWGSTPTIEIDIDDFGRLTETQREALMYHELGHCVLNRTHNDGYIDDSNCANSIMNRFIINQTCYDTYYVHYINELFNLSGVRALAGKKSKDTDDPLVEEEYYKEIEFTCPKRGKVKQRVKIKKYKTVKEAMANNYVHIDSERIEEDEQLVPTNNFPGEEEALEESED